MIWLALALMIALALGFLLPPVLRARNAESAARAEYDLAIYRDQLKELETDLARGTVTAAEAAEAKLEIERRLLRAAPRGVPERAARSRIAGPVVALGVPVLAVAIYLAIGAPHLPGRSATSPSHPPVAGGGEAAEFSRMAERLAAKLAENPDSPEEWRLLGRTYMELGRYGEAANAFRQGQRLIPTDADLPTMLGEALVLNAENTVTPAAVAAFEASLKLDPRHPIARYYIGLGRLQAGATREAFDRWLELARESQPDAPWMRVLPGQLAELAKQLKVDLAAAWPQPAAPGAIAGAKGPNAEQMQAAAEMSPEDRQQFIRGMVERLADRLKDNAEDLDGWQRLARAYRVLGDNDKAVEAEKRVATLQGSARPAPAPAATPPSGPTQEQMQAAAQMPDQDRAQMIRGMVERLADRLKDNPNDLDGWQRLARSYRVLGENDKAAEAEKRAADLQAGGRATPPPQAPAPAAPPPGPSQEQMRAAVQMPPEDRSRMIRGMVDQLAEKLRDNPNDFEGWSRLGRSYFVLGEPGKAVEAYAKAASLKPEDPLAVANHAQAIAEAGDPRGPLPAESIRLFREVLKMDALNPQALWAVGLAEAQAGNRTDALEKWRRLLGRLPPGTPEFAQLQRRIADLEKATQ